MRRCNRPITDHLCITCPYERAMGCIDIFYTWNSTSQLIWIILIVLASFTFRLLSIVSMWFFSLFVSVRSYLWMDEWWMSFGGFTKKNEARYKDITDQNFQNRNEKYEHTYKGSNYFKYVYAELGKYICEMSVWWENRADENKK